MKLEKLLVPVDFSQNSRAAVRAAIQLLGRSAEAKLIVLFVLEPLHIVFGEMLPQELPTDAERQRAVEERMKALSAEFRDVAMETRIVEGHAWERICQFAKDAGIDLIIIPSHGYRGLTRLVLGSTAERVVRHASCPVLVLKPGDIGASEIHQGSVVQ